SVVDLRAGAHRFVNGGLALYDQLHRVILQCMAFHLFACHLHEHRGIGLVRGLHNRPGHLKHLVNTGTPQVAGAVALGTTTTFAILGIVRFAAERLTHPFVFLWRQLRHFPATFTDHAQQPLCQYDLQRHCHHVTGGTHVHEPDRRANGIVGVQRGENHVPRHRGTQSGFHRVLVAHFAHQNHVRILAQRRAQDSGEGQFDLVVDLDLIDAGEPIFNRVFHSDDLALRRVELFECGIERGRLATASRSRNQHHAAWALDDTAQALQHVWRQADSIETEDAAALIQQTHHGRFAVLGRHRRNAHVDLDVPNFYVEAPVLWQPSFRDVQPGHELQPQDHRGGDFRVRFGLHVQHAVDPEADEHLVFLRFDMNVRNAHLDRVLEHGLQQLHHRRILGSGGHPERGKIDGFAELRTEFQSQPADFLGTSIDPVDGLQKQGLADDSQLNIAFQNTIDLIVGEQVGWIGHTYSIKRTGVLQYDRAETPRQRFGQTCGNFRANVEVLEIDIGNLQLPR